MMADNMARKSTKEFLIRAGKSDSPAQKSKKQAYATSVKIDMVNAG